MRYWLGALWRAGLTPGACWLGRIHQKAVGGAWIWEERGEQGRSCELQGLQSVSSPQYLVCECSV